MMQLRIDSPQMTPDAELTNRIESKFEQLGKMYDRIESCTVVLRKEKHDKQKNCFMEARMEVPKRTLFASETEETFELALDKLLDDLENQLRKFKEKMDERR